MVFVEGVTVVVEVDDRVFGDVRAGRLLCHYLCIIKLLDGQQKWER